MAKKEDRYKELYEGCTKLWRMLADEKDSNEIIEAAYKLVGNPIIVTTNTVLFKSIGIRSNVLLDKLFMVGYDETSKGDPSAVHIMPRKLALQDPQTNHGLIIAGIYDKQSYLGRVTITGASPFDVEITKCYAETLAKIMANVFSAEVFPQMNTFVSDFPLFHSFITGEKLDASRLGAKLKELDFDPKSGMNVVIIDQRDQPLLSALANMKKYADLFSCRIFSMYHGNIVLINCKSTGKKLAISELVMKTLKKDSFRCGVSREFFQLSDTPAMYRQALFALNMGEFYDDDSPVLEFEKYSAQFDICQSSRFRDPLTVLDPRFVKLKEYDDAGPGYLIDTLRAHFKNIKTPTEAANSLYIHRNTYFHRLAKIEELTGWDINDGDCIAKISYYLKLMDLLDQAEAKNLPHLYYLSEEE